MNLRLSLLASCFLAPVAAAQVDVDWSALNPAANSDATRVVTDSLGNVYVTGSNGGDMSTLKDAPSGTLLWSRTFGGSNGDVGRDIAIDTDGSVYVAGAFDSWAQLVNHTVYTYSNFGIVKYLADGTLDWSRVTTYFGVSAHIALDHVGGVYVSGSTHYDTTPGEELIVKCSTNGTEQ